MISAGTLQEGTLQSFNGSLKSPLTDLSRHPCRYPFLGGMTGARRDISGHHLLSLLSYTSNIPNTDACNILPFFSSFAPWVASMRLQIAFAQKVAMGREQIMVRPDGTAGILFRSGKSISFLPGSSFRGGSVPAGGALGNLQAVRLVWHFDCLTFKVLLLFHRRYTFIGVIELSRMTSRRPRQKKIK